MMGAANLYWGQAFAERLKSGVEMGHIIESGPIQPAKEARVTDMEFVRVCNAAQVNLGDKLDALVGERIRIAKVLEDFWKAELSMSAVQPVLDLARELNPHLK